MKDSTKLPIDKLTQKDHDSIKEINKAFVNNTIDKEGKLESDNSFYKLFYGQDYLSLLWQDGGLVFRIFRYYLSRISRKS